MQRTNSSIPFVRISIVISAFVLVLSCIAAVVVKGQLGEESSCRTVNDEGKSINGFCIDIKTQLKLCPPLHELLRRKDWTKLRTRICSGDNKRVCCSMDDFNETLAPNPIADRIASINFAAHRNFKVLPSLRVCGAISFVADKILGGNKSSPGELPFVARLGFQSVGVSPVLEYNCGGTIISKRYILTAAHCFKDPTKQLVHVRIGQSDEDLVEECIDLSIRSSREGDDIQQRRARQINGDSAACGKPIDMLPEDVIVHPGYTKLVGSSHDIALIRLAHDINFNSYFTRPICLPFLNEYYVKSQLEDVKIFRNNLTHVAGFGKLYNEDQVGSTTLQFVKAPIQANIMCRIAFKDFNITSSQICAGGSAGEGSCLGDSGGPLYRQATPDRVSRVNKAFQLGIVSFGKTKCAGNEPVVYTKVRSYLEWILDNIRE